MSKDTDVYSEARSVLELFPSDDQYNQCYEEVEQTRRKISAKVDELIKALEEDRNSVIADRKQHQEQSSALKENISNLKRRIGRREEELGAIKEDITEKLEELKLINDYNNEAETMLKKYKKAIGDLEGDISDATKSEDVFKKLSNLLLDVL